MHTCASLREFQSFPLIHTFNMLVQKLSWIILLLFLCQHGIEAGVICEGKAGVLSCSFGTIRVITANYGRTDRTTCVRGKPYSQISNTRCRVTATNTVSNRCNRKKTCVVPASNSLFGDPCVGTYKYLDIVVEFPGVVSRSRFCLASSWSVSPVWMFPLCSSFPSGLFTVFIVHHLDYVTHPALQGHLSSLTSITTVLSIEVPAPLCCHCVVSGESTICLDEFIARSITRMDAQEESLTNTEQAVQALVAQVSELTQKLQHWRSPAAPPTPPVQPLPLESPFQSEHRLPVLEAYSGEPSYCRAFLTRCSMHFSLQPRTFNSELSKVAFVLTLLTGRGSRIPGQDCRFDRSEPVLEGGSLYSLA
ncbi:unnamed protein product [Leuciscus chuanchicus]